jgi:hypothetical protein
LNPDHGHNNPFHNPVHPPIHRKLKYYEGVNVVINDAEKTIKLHIMETN